MSASAVTFSDQLTVRFLPADEFNRLAAVYRLHNEPLPDADNAVILVLEHDSEIIASMAFHRVLMLGLVHVKPEWIDTEALDRLTKTAAQSFASGDHLFTVVTTNWARENAQR